jgi:LPXTG-site transpeptidase (sortase) family protein
MQSVFLRCKLFGKDLGSWLIILGYGVIVVGTVTIIRDWVPNTLVSDPIGDFPTSVQGFIPLLDSLDSSSEGIVVNGRINNEEGYISSNARLTALAPWEVGLSPEQDPLESVSEESGVGTGQNRWLPDRLTIATIQLDVPIQATEFKEVEIQGVTYRQWLAPDSRTVGWQSTSAGLGDRGNTVLVGHHNIDGEVFRDLDKLEVGDLIRVYSSQRIFEYRVRLKMILPEKYESIETRLENARWIQATQDERLTLVTCWPYETNSHRLILVAEPVDWGSVGIWGHLQIDP